MQWPSDEEAGFAAPSEPIRVTMVQDEEHPISEGGEEVVEEEERELPPPPPAYGLWRSSVVCPPSHHFTIAWGCTILIVDHRERTPTSSTGNPSANPTCPTSNKKPALSFSQEAGIDLLAICQRKRLMYMGMGIGSRRLLLRRRCRSWRNGDRLLLLVI